MRKFSKTAIIQALQVSSLTYDTMGERVQCTKTVEWDLAGEVWRIEDVTSKISRTVDTLFTDKESKNVPRHIHASNLGKSLLRALRTDFSALRQHYPMHVFNPYVEEFIKQATERHIWEAVAYLRSLRGDEIAVRTTALNDFVASLRKTCSTPEFLNAIADFKRKANKNCRSLQLLINEHFKTCGRMLVLRIDFGYQKDETWPPAIDAAVSYAQTKIHREQLLAYLKKAVPQNSYLASACKMEYGLDKKWHYHVLLLLDGSIVREDVTIAKMIGEHWKKTITQGKGVYWNCNGNKESYKTCGIGMLNYYDVDARAGLDKAVEYMTKPDYYAKLLVPGNDRTFWKGNMPKPVTTTKGRPRMKGPDHPGDAALPV